MTTFRENPYTTTRNMVNSFIFKKNLNSTLDSKFKHKKFSERFAPANTAFLSLGLVAQISSSITAYVMLSYLFEGTPFIVRLVASITLLVAIEVIKRLSTNDVMQSLFQYGYAQVEPFAAILGAVTIATSIYIAVEGAKILPSLLVGDAVQEQPKQQTPDAINTDYDNRIAAVVVERDQHRKSRMWKGRLAGKDSKVIEQYNKDIKALQVQKEEALAGLKADNQAAQAKAIQLFEERSEQVKIERADLGPQLVIAAIGFEVLFVISMCFSWWYYVECEKERQELQKLKGNAEKPVNTSSTAKVDPSTLAVKEEALVEEIGARNHKIGFRDYEDAPPTTEVEKVRRDYTRICPQCDAPFIHNSHNHTYCQRSCAVAARDADKKKNA